MLPLPAPSLRSRAARRALSPSLATKSPEEERARHPDIKQPSILAIHHGAGVTKKAKKNRKSHLSSRARKRHERDIDMAEAVLERTAQKFNNSMDQLKNIRSRRKPWDEVNSSVVGGGERSGKQKKKRMIAAESSFAVLGEDCWETDEEVEEEEEEIQEKSAEMEESTPVLKRRVVPSQGIIVPEMVIATPDVDDEIL
jgi:hypothetical protein